MRQHNKGSSANRIRLTARRALMALAVIWFLVVWGNLRLANNITPANNSGNGMKTVMKKVMDPADLAKLMASRPDVTSPSGGAAACLLVMDDNHLLIEWLAYHYHTLPLRYLVIAMDPKSKTSPQEVLNRWTGVANLTIVPWYQDSDYATKEEFELAEEQVKRYFGDNHSPELFRHRARQRMFYFKCMQHLKKQGRHWTALIDTDEYLTLSYDTLRKYGREDAPGIDQPGSVLKFLNKELQRPDAYQNVTSPCVQIPRIRFGTRESEQNEVEVGVPIGFTGFSFQTLRWRKHVGENNFAANKISKTLIDLRRVSWDELQPVDSIHRPLRSLCGRRKLHIRKSQQALVIHHYIGTWEQYSFREDAREEMDGRSQAVSGNVESGRYVFLVCPSHCAYAC